MKITIIILNLLLFCVAFFLLAFVKKREKIPQIVTFESESGDSIFDTDFMAISTGIILGFFSSAYCNMPGLLPNISFGQLVVSILIVLGIAIFSVIGILFLIYFCILIFSMFIKKRGILSFVISWSTLFCLIEKDLRLSIIFIVVLISGFTISFFVKNKLIME